MVEKSLYSQIIKNESRKVKTIAGVCCNFVSCSENENNSDDDRENIELLRNILIDNGNCGEKKRRKHKNCREHEHNRDNTPTNIYKFANQDFLDNYLGRSNIEESYINHDEAVRKAQIDRILEKYGRKCRKFR